MNANSAKLTAIPFITVTKNKQFEISKEAEAYLSSLEGKKLGIVSIAGKYRTGKSYFLNKLIQNRREKPGFEVGPTINSCTKGIWIWPQTFKSENPDEEDLEVLVLDTEGFGGINENQNHDTRIFIFSLLLSSMFIYNSIGSIDENALQTLSLIVNLAKNIQLGEAKNVSELQRNVSDSLVSDISQNVSQNITRRQSGLGQLDQSEESIADNFPFFLWIIRDFCLELKDSFGNPITSKNYFENALKGPVNGNQNSSDGKNKIRTMIKQYFKSRDCVTMVRPVEKEADLQNLDNLDDSQLRPEFVLQIKKTRKMILMKTNPKRIKGSTLDGPKFFQLAMAYVKSINAGSAPNIDSAWNYIVQFENEKKLKLIYEKIKSTKTCIRNKKDIDVIIESLLSEFENEKIGTTDESEDIRRKVEAEIRHELENDCLRFTEILKTAVREKVEDALDSLKKAILDLEQLDLHQIDQMVEKTIASVVAQFKGEQSEKEIRTMVDKIFNKNKSELYQLAMKQQEKVKIRETKELENRKVDAERRLKEVNEQLNLKVDEISKRSELEQLKYSEVVKEKQKITFQYDQLKEERDKLNTKLRAKETELLRLEGELIDSKAEEMAKFQVKIDELTIQLQESESNAEKQASLLNGKIKYLETNISKLKSEMVTKEQETAEILESLEERTKTISNLHQKIKNLAPPIPDTHLLVEKTKLADMKNKISANEDLKDNYEKIIREVLEERNMVQNQFEFLKENFELEKNKNFKLLNEIHAKVSARRDTETIAPSPAKLYSEVGDKENNKCPHCDPRPQVKLTDSKSKINNQIDYCPDNKSCKFNENLEISVTNVALVKSDNSGDQNNARTNIFYCIDINNNKKNWSVQKKFRDFFDLVVKLQRVLKKTELPSSSKELWNFVKDIWGTTGSKSFPLENRRIMIEKIMRDLAMVSIIRNSPVFIEFLNEESFNQ